MPSRVGGRGFPRTPAPPGGDKPRHYSSTGAGAPRPLSIFVGEGLVPSRVERWGLPQAPTTRGGDKPRHYRSAGGETPRPPFAWCHNIGALAFGRRGGSCTRPGWVWWP